MNFEALKSALVEALVGAGITEYEIYYMSNSEASVATLNKAVNSSSSAESGGLCLRLVVDGKMGYASTELMTEAEMTELVDRAISNAKATEKPDTVGIYGGSESYEESRIPKYVPMSVAELSAAAVKTGEAIYAKSDKVQDGTSTQAVSAGFVMRLVNSSGVDLESSSGINVLIGEAVVMDNGEMQADYAMREISAETCDATVAEVTEEAVKAAISKLGATLVPSGKYNVVVSGKQMRSILSVFSSAFSAKAVKDGMSPLAGKLGTAIAAPIVTITDDPQREGSSVGTTFDAEGVATHRKSVVENGVLLTYLHNRETAKEMGVESTANASKAGYSSPIGIRPYSFCIEPGDKSAEELLSMAGTGIYITEVKGLHAGANPITGDFSLESEGFMIRDGKLCEAVKSFTVAGNFFELLSSVAALGNELRCGVQTGMTGFGSPDVLFRDMSIAGA